MIKEVLEVLSELAGSVITMIGIIPRERFCPVGGGSGDFTDQGEIIEGAAPQQFFTQPKSART